MSNAGVMSTAPRDYDAVCTGTWLTPTEALRAEVAELRTEVAALRAELPPRRSFLVVGDEAVREYRRLTK